jgi:hypothetical protein
MHIPMTASCTVAGTMRIWMNDQYVKHHSIRLGEMTLVMLRAKNTLGRKCNTLGVAIS